MIAELIWNTHYEDYRFRIIDTDDPLKGFCPMVIQAVTMDPNEAVKAFRRMCAAIKEGRMEIQTGGADLHGYTIEEEIEP